MTYSITAAVNTQLGCQRDAADEEEQRIERIGYHLEQRVDRERLVDGRRDKIDQ